MRIQRDASPPTGQATPCNAQALIIKAVRFAAFRKIAKA
jgi:hypothetical protein